MKAAPLSHVLASGILADLRLPGALEALDAILQGVDGGRLTEPEADRATAVRPDAVAQ